MAGGNLLHAFILRFLVLYLNPERLSTLWVSGAQPKAKR
jgi:hypothetical protein